jgi:hypothetical protein
MSSASVNELGLGTWIQLGLGTWIQLGLGTWNQLGLGLCLKSQHCLCVIISTSAQVLYQYHFSLSSSLKISSMFPSLFKTIALKYWY